MREGFAGQLTNCCLVVEFLATLTNAPQPLLNGPASVMKAHYIPKQVILQSGTSCVSGICLLTVFTIGPLPMGLQHRFILYSVCATHIFFWNSVCLAPKTCPQLVVFLKLIPGLYPLNIFFSFLNCEDCSKFSLTHAKRNGIVIFILATRPLFLWPNFKILDSKPNMWTGWYAC